MLNGCSCLRFILKWRTLQWHTERERPTFKNFLIICDKFICSCLSASIVHGGFCVSMFIVLFSLSLSHRLFVDAAVASVVIFVVDIFLMTELEYITVKISFRFESAIAHKFPLKPNKLKNISINGAVFWEICVTTAHNFQLNTKIYTTITHTHTHTQLTC